MTHKELVQRAIKWLRNTRRCSIVVSENRTSGKAGYDAPTPHLEIRANEALKRYIKPDETNT